MSDPERPRPEGEWASPGAEAAWPDAEDAWPGAEAARRRRTRRLVGCAVLVVAGLVAAVLSWRAGIVTSHYPPLTGEDGRVVVPAFDATRYDGLWITIAVAAATVAGCALIGLVTGLRDRPMSAGESAVRRRRRSD